MTDDLVKFLRTSTSSAYNKTAADLIEKLENSLAWYQMMDAMSSDHVVELTDKLEAAEAKLTKAVEALRLYAHDYVYSGSKARAVLAELEGKE